MKGLHIAILVSLGLLAGAAQGVTIDFDDLAPQAVLTNQYPGVTFSNSIGLLRVFWLVPGAPFTPPNSIEPPDMLLPSVNIATFAVPAGAVSVVMGDFNGDEDTLHLEAYNAENVLLASDTQVLPAPTWGGLTLSVSAPNIAYVKFWGVGFQAGNNVYFDNFTFRDGEAEAVIPEPVTMAALLLGVGGLGGYLRRRWA